MKVKYLFALASIGLIAGCATVLRDPVVRKNEPINQYRYALVSKTAGLSASSGAVYGDRAGIFGSSSSKTLSPGAVIEGILLKKGLMTVDEVHPESIDKTLLVRYGESGRRDINGGMGGYTLEVTIVLVSAKTSNIVYSCSAEGQGETEADDIRQAISRCLSSL